MVCIINGRIVGEDSGDNGKPPKTVENIPAGSKLEHDGPVVVLNEIGAGAVVKITNGNLTAKNVEDGAKIKVKQGGSAVVNRTITHSFNGGVSISFSQSQGVPAEINITGQVGNDVTLAADYSIKIKNAGDNLHVKADHCFEGGKIGAQAFIDAAHNISINELGEGAELMAGHNINLGALRQDGSAQSGHNFTAATVYEKCTVMSGHNIKIDQAHHSARLNAGHKKNVGAVFGKPDPISFVSKKPKNRFDF